MSFRCIVLIRFARRFANAGTSPPAQRSEEHTSELQSRQYLVCRLLLEKNSTERATAPITPPLKSFPNSSVRRSKANRPATIYGMPFMTSDLTHTRLNSSHAHISYAAFC